MKIRFLQIKRVLQTALFVALLSVVTMTKAQTENIAFADANVKAICVANWDTDGDGELNTTEAAAVTNLDGAFMFDDGIASFNELQFFTGLTSFGEDEFNSCTSLAAISIPSAVNSIGNYAFSDCSSLASMTSYACTPPALGNEVFYNVPSIVVLNVPCHTSAMYQEVDGWSDFANYEEFEYGLCPIPFADDNVKAICVAHWDTNEDGELSYAEAAAVTNLGTYFKSTAITAFDELEYFTSLTSLPNTAFYGCTSLVSITLPASVLALGNGSFYNCTSLATMTVYAETPPTVGTNAFKNVPTNMVVHVPCETFDAYQNDSVWSIFSLFDPCLIVFADSNVKALCVANWDTNGDNELSYAEAAAVTNLGQVFRSNKTITSFNELQYFIGLTSIGSNAFSSCSGLTSIEIPNSVTLIFNFAFSSCSGLTSVEIPNSVTLIGSSAFSSCSGLTSVEIPNSVTSIGYSAFSSCRGLTSIEIPNSVTSIGSYAFSSCSSMTSIEIPNSVINIGTNPFSYCSKLEQIIVDSGNIVYDSRENCNAIINTNANKLMVGCKNTVIPNSVTSIGEYAFYGCRGLNSIEIPNSVTSIGDFAFTGCNDLISIEISNSVASIGSNAFNGCGALTSLTVLADNPPTLSSGVFYNVNEGIPVYVPCGNVESYTTANWGDFNNFVGLCGGTVTVSVSPDEGGIVAGGGTFGAGESCTVTAIENEGYTFALWIRNGTLVSYDAEYTFYVSGEMNLVAHFIPEGNIVFADANVKSICVSHWDTNGDNELSFFEASMVTSLGDVFRDNVSIYSFDELQYFIRLKSIGEYTFSGCNGLTSIEIPLSVTSIGYNAFYSCYGLTSMTIWSENPPVLNYNAFNFISVINKSIPVYVPCNAVEDYQNAYGWNEFTRITGMCSGEIAVTVNPSESGTVTGAGYYEGGDICVLTATPNPGFSFGNWSENGVVVSSDTVYSFRAHATTITANFCSNSPIVFADTTVKALCVANWDTNGDEELSYAEAAAVTGLGQVFRNNSYISTFNEFQYFIGLTSIDEEAFSHCSNLTSIEIPHSVTHIGFDAFSCCYNLNSITIWAGNPPDIDDGLIWEEELKTRAYGSGDSFGGVNRSIPVYVLCDAVEAYQNAYIWDEFTNIIGMCSGEVAVTINPSESGIVSGFGYYDGGDICVLRATPNSGFSFGNWTENGLVVSTDSVYVFHAYPTTIIANFYSNSPIVFADAIVKALCVANWDTNGDGELSYVEAANVPDLGVVFKNNSSISSFNELQYFTSLVSIDNETFSSCSNLTSIEIPNSVTSIKYRAFYNCINLTSFEIPNAVTSIDNLAFYGCSGLEQITVDSENTVYDSRGNSNAIIETETDKLMLGCKNTIIPNSVTSIGSYAFYLCSGLTSIEIPNAVTSIGYGTFWGCTGLTSIEIPNSVTYIGEYAFRNCTNLTSIEIPNSVTSIGDWAFRNCTSLTSIEIPYSMTSIGGAVFYGCRGLTSIEIPNSVTSIGGSAFYGCSGLTSIEIPNSVTTIGNYAFSGCTGLTLLTVKVDNPPTITIYTFQNVPKSIPVYVPCGKVEAYQSAAYWSEFTNIQELCTQVQTIELSEGWNWVSFNVEITLDDLKAALVTALPGTNSITIKSKNEGAATYNGTVWRGQLGSLDLSRMYRVYVEAACEITLEGMSINPAEHPITLSNGFNWIAFPFSESKTLTEAFAGFAINGDAVKSKGNGAANYNGTSWRGTLNALVPGQGYIYKSNAVEDRVFTFPMSAK